MNKKTEKEKSQNSATLTYSGDVKIQYIRNNKIVKTIKKKNSGTDLFFSILAKSIAGNNESKNMPKFIHLYNYENSKYNSVCPNNIPYKDISVEKDSGNDGYKISFEFLIPFTQFNGTCNYIALFSSVDYDTSNALAVIDLGEDKKLISDSNSNILITWVLRVQNKN